MTRLVGLLVAAVVLMLSLLVPTAVQAQDAETVFAYLDIDGDRKISKSEFDLVADRVPLLKNAFIRNRLFDRLDEGGDGGLTVEEFSKAQALRNQVRLGAAKPEAKSPGISDPAGMMMAPEDAKPLSPEQVTFFESKIRPVLVAQCYKCHSAEAGSLKGGLALDSREGIRTGGDSGPGVVPGDLEESLVWTAINWEDYQMPPKQKLPESVIADFKTWIMLGAADPRVQQAREQREVRSEIDIEAGRDFWAFLAPEPSTPPQTSNTQWAATDIDRFVLAKLEEQQLQPAAPASPEQLLRRMTFDLTGLPPSPEDFQQFLAAWKTDPEAAYAAKVDQLLASPRFGERWGRHWLDVARYAESSGKEVNMTYPHAWRYRDYVIDSFNEDKPYDQFIMQQIAGDQLPYTDDSERQEHLIATGFLAIGTKSLNEASLRQFTLDVADEQIDAVSQSFLGMTIACARCHDHKSDPIPTTDYYALQGIFQSTETLYGTANIVNSRRGGDLLELPLADDRPIGSKSSSQFERTKERLEDLEEQFREVIASNRANRNSSMNNIVQTLRLRSQIASLRAQLNNYDEVGNPLALAMGVRDRRTIRDANVLVRGELDKPAQQVERGFLSVLSDPANPVRLPSDRSGRLELAEWIASAENPLTARVMVNRIWLHLMGRGLVDTPNNFGVSGKTPSHPELLDHLAVRFVDEGWSVKSMIREIVLSQTYRMGSEYREDAFQKDPSNTYYWRMTPRQLDAESLRDAMLAASGELDVNRPTGSVVAEAGDVPVGRLFGESQINRSSNYRSVYLPIVRDSLPEPLALFDAADASTVTGQRDTSVVPRQALYLMNDEFVLQQSRKMAERIMSEAESQEERIKLAFLLAYGREANRQELLTSMKFGREFYASVMKKGVSTTRAEQYTYASLCQALLASAEFRILE